MRYSTCTRRCCASRWSGRPWEITTASSADSATQTGTYYDIFTLPKFGEAGGVASGTEAYYSFDFGNIHFIVLDSMETAGNERRHADLADKRSGSDHEAVDHLLLAPPALFQALF